jgi:glutamine amidotransferase
MQTLALIDYGSGNLPSAEKALRRAANDMTTLMAVVTTDDPEVIAQADRLVLPGVGAFAACMAALEARPGVLEAMVHAAMTRGAPFLGVCVGMQLMATRGLEFGLTTGLGWIDGDVHALRASQPSLKIPHMGWNSLEYASPSPLFQGLGPGVHMYFTHSFAIHADTDRDVIAWSEHGDRFVAAVARDNVAGVQFHPEKSQGAGARLLSNFLNWRP